MKKLALLITSVAAAAAVVAACSQGGAEDKSGAGKPGAQAPAAIPVSTIRVEPRPVPLAFDAVGRTEGSRDVQVRARVSGIVEQQLYTEGDKVKAGQPLFRIERAPYEIDLAQQRASLAQEKAKLSLARQQLARIKGLVDRRAISQQEADQAASSVQQSVAAVQLAEARVRQAELNLSYTTVRAPIGGISGRALQSIGSLVSPNADSALLTTITRGDPIWVRFALSEPEYAKVREADPAKIQVTVELAEGSKYPLPGKVNFAGSTVDATTGTVQMRAALPNPKLALLPGQYVRVHVIAGTQKAIVVPQTAVMQNESGQFVWVVGGESGHGAATPRPIKAGQWLGQDWVVLDGLKAGDSVIVDNLVRLRPGVPVQVKNTG